MAREDRGRVARRMIMIRATGREARNATNLNAACEVIAFDVSRRTRAIVLGVEAKDAGIFVLVFFLEGSRWGEGVICFDGNLIVVDDRFRRVINYLQA